MALRYGDHGRGEVEARRGQPQCCKECRDPTGTAADLQDFGLSRREHELGERAENGPVVWFGRELVGDPFRVESSDRIVGGPGGCLPGRLLLGCAVVVDVVVGPIGNAVSLPSRSPDGPRRVPETSLRGRYALEGGVPAGTCAGRQRQ